MFIIHKFSHAITAMFSLISRYFKARYQIFKVSNIQ